MRKRVHSDKPVAVADFKRDSAKEIAARKLIKATERPIDSPLPPAPYKLTREDALSCYRGVMEVYQSQDTHRIVFGRDRECERVVSFLDKNIETADSGLIYLCGHPGTGKTSMLNQLLQTYEGDQKIMICKYNANSYREFPVLLKDLVNQVNEKCENSNLKKKRKTSTGSQKSAKKSITQINRVLGEDGMIHELIKGIISC